MAGAVVGGAFLSGFINIVINKSLREDVVNLVLGKKLGSDLVERLKISLFAAEAVLDDAEYKQLGDDRVRDWLNCLRDAVYDADDFLDAVLTKAATQKEVRSFLPGFFLNRHRKMADNMEGVVARIEFLVNQKDNLGLQKSTKDNNLSSSSSSWRETTCLMEGNIYGRENDQQALIKIINDKSESQLSVIPIVGMGGVGKTTLAKWAYSVVEGFDLKAWVCISETFDVDEITKKTIEEITKTTCSLGSLNLLQNELQKILSGKKFFIVLDDVWSEDANKWKQFITPFQCGAKGSTILLTTRNQEVASVVQTCPSCTLNELSEESCWLLFAANACFPESNRNPTLVDVGRQIVNKCKGLPLAVETLGRMLGGKDDVEEWKAVLRSAIWDFPMKNSKIIPALLISYFQLPPYLKRCFVYCSLFPKDYYFNKDKLILLWMAEDLLRLPKRGESLEEVGSQCFEELASRLFFKPYKFSSKIFLMHDLLHDLAIFLAGDFYGRIEELGEQEEKKLLTRHLSHISRGSLGPPISKVFNSDMKSESLRTSLYIKDLLSMKSKASKLKYLRVLSFR
ncbi:putative disease resistance RPP13-like protein 1 [Arachis hypogaea]|uniref:putative disease resistance RPP13-like protein 1 n=1 Tax=Arachis hypogaea TaxID=3818 RepID=UPI0007AF37BA|nr:putative disease resistance RPP13-like protein 1 [Arachis hypogaea]QHO22219.1 Putative disease resistance RPP13-like protein [Arachis hypogaea]